MNSKLVPSIVFGLTLIASIHTVGCATASESTEASSASLAAVDADYAKVVGKWQFVYDDSRRAAVEADLAKSIHDPQKLAAAKKDAEDEAASSTVELTADREYKSFIGDEMILHERCKTMGRGPTPGSVECTPDALLQRIIGGKPQMRLDGDELVMTDPRKGDLRFRRIQ